MLEFLLAARRLPQKKGQRAARRDDDGIDESQIGKIFFICLNKRGDAFTLVDVKYIYLVDGEYDLRHFRHFGKQPLHLTQQTPLVIHPGLTRIYDKYHGREIGLGNDPLRDVRVVLVHRIVGAGSVDKNDFAIGLRVIQIGEIALHVDLERGLQIPIAQVLIAQVLMPGGKFPRRGAVTPPEIFHRIVVFDAKNRGGACLIPRRQYFPSDHRVEQRRFSRAHRRDYGDGILFRRSVRPGTAGLFRHGNLLLYIVFESLSDVAERGVDNAHG